MILKHNTDFLFDTMEDVFSVLSPEEVVGSSREIVRRYLGNELFNIREITWVEFDPDGTFVRGGRSDAELMLSSLLYDWRSDQVVADIVEQVHDRHLRPGQLIKARNREGHYWCVPYRTKISTGNLKNHIRAIYLTDGLFYEILDLFNSDACLTRSEKRIIYQIVVGLNPGLAAKSDGVSVETKRTQLKMAAAKLQCHSQSELVRYFVSQLIHLLYLCESETSEIKLTEEFGSSVFGDRGRLSVQRLPNERVVRFWEFGPSNGAPILVMHGYLFPTLVLDAEPELEKHRLRLILPLRGGFLDDKPASGTREINQMVKDNVKDLLQFVEHIWGEPVPILGHNMGGVYAMLLAKERPELFKEVIVASINLMRNSEGRTSTTSRIVGGLRRLANDVGIYELAARRLQKSVLQNEKGSKLLLRRLFKDSPCDLDVVNGRAGSGPAFEWFQKIALHSATGFASDVSLLSGPIDDFIKGMTKPVTFVHGSADPYTSVGELHGYVSLNPLATAQVLDVGGHYVSASHPSTFWQAINNCLK